MHLRRQKITTCSVHTTIVIALDRLAAPRAPRTNLEFQISDQRWSLCTPCICDCCSIRVKITTCMDMHGAALVYPYILGGGLRLPGASGPLGHWPASANGAPKSARKMTCKRLPKCVRDGSRNEPKRLQQRFLYPLAKRSKTGPCLEMARCDILMLFATLEQGQPSPQVLHLGSHSGTHLVSESLRKYTPSVIQKKSPKSVQNWSSFGTLLGSLGALHALPSPSKWAAMTCSCPPRASKAPFWDAFGTLGVTAKRAIAIVFCALIQLHLGRKPLYTLL